MGRSMGDASENQLKTAALDETFSKKQVVGERKGFYLAIERERVFKKHVVGEESPSRSLCAGRFPRTIWSGLA